jgi:hypothetical protein
LLLFFWSRVNPPFKPAAREILFSGEAPLMRFIVWFGIATALLLLAISSRSRWLLIAALVLFVAVLVYGSMQPR